MYIKERRGLQYDSEFMEYDPYLYSKEEALIEHSNKYLFKAMDIKEKLEDEVFTKGIEEELKHTIETLYSLIETNWDLNLVTEEVTKVQTQIQVIRCKLANYNTKQDKLVTFIYLKEIEDRLIDKYTQKKRRA